MEQVIGVQFQKNGKIYYFNANGIIVSPGQYVIVDTTRGQDLGEVLIGVREADESLYHTPLKKVIRIASEQDIQHSIENREKEKEALNICQQKILEHKLEMKLVSVECAFDNSKIVFYFTANGRVDFRSLVKDLASIFKMRIELRQIGVRDEAKMLGGLGPCGRTICCGSFLDQFQPVSIKMAKEQNLSLNPTKISGVCGRLMCCLKYEQDHYEQTRKKMPKVGKTVSTPDGSGPVTDLNIVKETVFVRLVDGDSSEIKEYPLEMIAGSEKTIMADPVTLKDALSIPEKSVDKKLPDTAASSVDAKSADTRNINEFSEHDNNEKKIRSRQKNKTNHNSSQLGKPVRRENPNKSNEPARKNAVTAPNNDKNVKTIEEKKDISGNKSWADALQKAINAIHTDN